ncbi:MAG: O-antigen ligase family protein [Comamonadaceae bacterium]|nr:O-antigen ligase family protein [Comamonadaceae bacterium]
MLLIGAALSASRMAWLFSMVTAGVVTLMQAWPERSLRTRLLIAMMLIGGFAAANYGAATVLAVVDERCVSGVARLAVANETGTAIRLDLWRQAIEVWNTSPLVGVGVFNVLPAVFRMETLDVHHAFDMYAHNTALQILAEFGVVGAGVVAAIVLYWLARLVTNRRTLVASDAVFVLWLGVMGVHAMLEFPLHYVLPPLVRPDARHACPAGAAAWDFGARDAPAAGSANRRSLRRWGCRLHRLREARPLVLARGAEGGVLGTADAGSPCHDRNGGRRHRALPLASRSSASHQRPNDADELASKIAITDRLLSHSPHPVLMARRVILAILDDDPTSARWHLQRLFGFYPGAAKEMEEQFRRFITNRPDEFAVLAPILDEELARRPKARW